MHGEEITAEVVNKLIAIGHPTHCKQYIQSGARYEVEPQKDGIYLVKYANRAILKFAMSCQLCLGNHKMCIFDGLPASVSENAMFSYLGATQIYRAQRRKAKKRRLGIKEDKPLSTIKKSCTSSEQDITLKSQDAQEAGSTNAIISQYQT